MRPGLWTEMFRPCKVPFRKATELLREAGFECAELCERYAAEAVDSGIRISLENLIVALDADGLHLVRLDDLKGKLGTGRPMPIVL